MIICNLPLTLPPADLLEQAVKTGNLEHLEQWFINQRSPGYSFSVIADFIEERRSTIPEQTFPLHCAAFEECLDKPKSKAKRAASTTRKARKATAPKMETPQL